MTLIDNNKTDKFILYNIGYRLYKININDIDCMYLPYIYDGDVILNIYNINKMYFDKDIVKTYLKLNITIDNLYNYIIEDYIQLRKIFIQMLSYSENNIIYNSTILTNNLDNETIKSLLL